MKGKSPALVTSSALDCYQRPWLGAGLWLLRERSVAGTPQRDRWNTDDAVSDVTGISEHRRPGKSYYNQGNYQHNLSVRAGTKKGALIPHTLQQSAVTQNRGWLPSMR